MATLEQMDVENARKAPPPPDVEFEGGSDDDQVLIDLVDAFALLNQAAILFGYLGDPVLCPRTLKKDRETIARLTAKIKDYLDETESQYEEG